MLVLGSYHFLPGGGVSFCNCRLPTFSVHPPLHAQKILVPPLPWAKKNSAPHMAWAKKSGPPLPTQKNLG